jgi:predicted RND superfamily exporter protein
MEMSNANRKRGDRFVDGIVAHPWRTLLLGLALLGVLAPNAAKVKPDFSYRVWFHDDDPLIVAFDAFERRFGNDEATLVVLHSPSGIFDGESIAVVQEMTAAMWKVHDVIRVDSIANFNWVHAEEDDIIVEPLIPDDQELTAELLAARAKLALGHETLPGWLISKDGKTALLMAAMKPSFGGSPDYIRIVKEFREMAAGFEGRGDHEIYLTGGPFVNDAFREINDQDLGRILPTVMLLTILFLLALFRRVAGVVLALVVVALTAVSTFAFSGILGIPFNNMTSIVPQILLAVGVADAVHVLVTFFDDLRRTGDRRKAARHALRKNLQPTMLTSVSTAIGFFAFSTAAVAPISQLGILAGIGTLLAWVYTYFVFGPLIILLPLKARGKQRTAADEASPRGVAFAAWLQAKRTPIIAVSAVVCVGAGITASTNEVNSDAYAYFRDDAALNIAAHFLEDNLGGSVPTEIVVDSGKEEGFKDPAFLEKVEAFQAWVEEKPYVTSTVSLVDILKSMNRSLHGGKQEHYKLPDTREGIAQQHLLYTMSLPPGMDLNDRVSVKNDALRISSMWDLHDSKRVCAAIDEMIEKAKGMGLDVMITGKTQLWQRMNPAVVRAFAVSLTTAIILMSLLMMLVFRSPGLGLLAIIPNGAPLLIGGGLLAAIGQHLDAGTVLVFSVCLGIAVDDTVHFLSNFNRLRGEGHEPESAIAHILTHTAPALCITTIVLVSAFGAFVQGQFIPLRNFGIMVAFILSVALLTDLTLLPALLLRREVKEAS